MVGGDELRAHGWLVCDEPKELRTVVKTMRGRASNRLEEVETRTTLYEPGRGRRAAHGLRRPAGCGSHAATRSRRGTWSPLADAKPSPTPYEERR